MFEMTKYPHKHIVLVKSFRLSIILPYIGSERGGKLQFFAILVRFFATRGHQELKIRQKCNKRNLQVNSFHLSIIMTTLTREI